jgi:hypothetical protein
MIINKDDIDSLKKLISTTTKSYEMFYFQLIQNVKTGSLQQRGKDGWDSFFTAWKQAIAALKIRRAYLLPLGSDAETCYREQDVWTYAVFTGFLFKHLKSALNLSVETLTKALLPSTGLQWLKAHPTVFDEWQDYWLDKSKEGSIFGLIEAQIAPVIDTPLAKPTLEPAEEPAATKTIDDFLAWLKQRVIADSAFIYQAQLLIHIIPEGCFCAMPLLLECFHEQYLLSSLPIDPKLLKQNIKHVSNAIPWIKNSQASYWHTLIKGEWENRETIKGFLLPMEILWGEDKTQWPAVSVNWKLEVGLAKAL